jgi:ParB/RepB/Spo0J family partition protein
MATTFPTTPAGTIAVSLEKIYVPANVRDLDLEHVDALAGSIALQGQLVPVLIAPADGQVAEQGFEFELVAGFHRYAAIVKLQQGAIDAVIRDRDRDGDGAEIAAARATENVARKQLNAYEEALAVKAMLERGLTEDGAAQALGWPKARVSARVKLLELPEAAQRLVGRGVLPLSCVDTLRSVGQVSPEILDAVVKYVADGNDWVIGRLHSEIGWVIARALSESGSKTFTAFLTHLDCREVEQLKLGKKATGQLAEIEQLHKQVNRHSYGPPPIRFSEQDVDQARAAGVLIESGSAPVIVDRGLYRELAKQTLTRTVDELRAQASTVSQKRKSGGRADGDQRVADPVGEVRREHGHQVRQLAAQAHGVNLDLGWALRNELATVDPADMNVARFMVYALLGSDYHGGYGKTGETIAELAVTGIRLVVEEFRTDVTKTKKDGSRGTLRIDYGNPHKPEDAITWMWKFVDGARTAGELYGRALVVIAAQQYASRLVLPASQQHRPLGWASHKDHAAKALAKLAGPCLPGSLKQLEKAVGKAKGDQDKQLMAIETTIRAAVDEFGTKQQHHVETGDDPDGFDEHDPDWGDLYE